MTHQVDHFSPHLTLSGALVTLFASADPTGLAAFVGPVLTLVGGIVSTISLWLTHRKERQIDEKLSELRFLEAKQQFTVGNHRLIVPPEGMSDT